MKRLNLAFALLTTACLSPAMANTYVYDAVCEDSYSKQGEQEDDLTKQAGKPIKCDAVVLSLLENGRALFQIAQKTGHLTPLGFAGPGFDYDSNPNFITLHLQSIYLPHPNNSGNNEKSME